MFRAWESFEAIVVPLLSPLDKRERIIERDLRKLVMGDGHEFMRFFPCGVASRSLRTR